MSKSLSATIFCQKRRSVWRLPQCLNVTNAVATSKVGDVLWQDEQGQFGQRAGTDLLDQLVFKSKFMGPLHHLR